MSTDEWLPEIEPRKDSPIGSIDRRPLVERSKLSERGMVDFRRVCDEMGILDPETDTIRVERTAVAQRD